MDQDTRDHMIDDSKNRIDFSFLASIIFLLSVSVFIHGTFSRTLGVTFVCIVSPDYMKAHHENGSTNARNVSECGAVSHQNVSDESLGYAGTRNWTSVTRGHIISIHNWVRLAFLPFSGFIVSSVDPRIAFAVATAVCGLTTGLLPVLVSQLDWVGALVSRLFLGAGHAFSSPALDHIMAQIIPQDYKSTSYALVTSGSQIAVIVGAPLAAAFCGYDFLGGWPLIFYLMSILAALWLVLWVTGILCCFKDHAVLVHLRPVGTARVLSAEAVKTFLHGFWENICLEPAMWGLLPCDIAATWAITMLTYYVPQFFYDVLAIPIKSNGLYSALPFLVLMITKLAFSATADWLKLKTRLTPNIVSKIFNTIGFLGSGLCALFSVTVPCVAEARAISLICVGAGLYSAVTPGFRTSLVSINREWTGVISAICTIMAMIASIVFVYVQAAVVPNGTRIEWRNLFIIMLCIDAAAAFMYGVFGSIEESSRVKNRRAGKIAPE